MIDPGKLNRRVILEGPTTTQDDYGQRQQAWTTLRTTWAGIRAASSKDIYASGGFVSELSHVITLRWSQQPLTSAMRIRYGSRIFQIQAISDPDESKVMQQLLCIERDA